MKKITFAMLITSMLFVLSSAALHAAEPPALFFSDLVSGPGTGGKDNKGVIVTIKGKNFGAAQGAGFVSVGGGKAAGYLVWNDTTISFQPGAEAKTGQITVTTADGTSNSIPFTVRPGGIYFVDDTSPGADGSGTFEDPWRTPASYYKAMRPGDTCYFREGTYSGQYGDSRANFNFGVSAPSGEQNNEIAFVGYPGETARLQGNGMSNIIFGSAKDYYTIAGFRMYSDSKCIGVEGKHVRIINNALEGLKTQAYGIIHPLIGDDIRIYGNELFGATSGNKKDHPIYVGYGSDNVDIGWNNFHDNNVAEGPVISVNTDYAITEGYKFENIKIHDNLIDCRKSSGALRAIGIIAADRGSSVYIYNNTIIESGGPTIYQYSGNSTIYNNVFYKSGGSAVISLGTVLDAGNDYRPETVDIKNNIFYANAGTEYFSINNEGAMTKVTLDSNAFYGSGSGPARDPRAVNADPLFENCEAGDFHLKDTSPCTDKGTDTSSLVWADKDGTLRPQGTAIDIGAFERYALQSPPQPQPNPEPLPQPQPEPQPQPPSQQPQEQTSINGFIKDPAGLGIAGVKVLLSGDAQQSVATSPDGSYQFAGLQSNGSYTVTPDTAQGSFSPPSRSVAGLSSQPQDFTVSPTAPALHSLSGSIKDKQGKGIEGVTVTLSGAQSATTVSGPDGSYRFTQVEIAGSATITPSQKEGILLSPDALTVEKLTADAGGKDFTATYTYHIKGSVASTDNTPLAATEVSLLNSASQVIASLITNESGAYEFKSIPENDTYTVTTTKEGFQFSPASRTAASLSKNVEGFDFHGAPANAFLQGNEVRIIGSSSGRGTINPDKGDAAQIMFRTGSKGEVKCKIFSLNGDLIWEDTKHDVEEGTFEWKPGSVATGIYVAVVRGPNLDSQKKIAVIR